MHRPNAALLKGLPQSLGNVRSTDVVVVATDLNSKLTVCRRKERHTGRRLSLQADRTVNVDHLIQIGLEHYLWIA